MTSNVILGALLVVGTFAKLFQYGRHFPNGNEAVSYIYDGNNGTFKYMEKPEYIWNYYAQYATPKHPYDKEALIKYASNGSHTTTCRDANGYLLMDFDHSGEIDPTAKGWAFHEHNGRGAQGITRGNAFKNFWYDDNFLARFMSIAYDLQQPYGLTVYNNFTRWQIMDGNTNNWLPYQEKYIDTLALDGLYYLSKQQYQYAKLNWQTIFAYSMFVYDQDHQQYKYPNITENYHMGLFMILTTNLMEIDADQTLLQHYVSLRSNVLSNQQRMGSSYLGWLSSIKDSNALMNTESTAVGTLALGATGITSYEAGLGLLYCTTCNFFFRPYHVISAVKGVSTQGYLSFGPFQSYLSIDPKYQCKKGCSVQYFLRFANNADPGQVLAVVDIHNAKTDTIIAQKQVTGADLPMDNKWMTIELELPNNLGESAAFEFRTYWTGHVNMDLAFIRVK